MATELSCFSTDDQSKFSKPSMWVKHTETKPSSTELQKHGGCTDCILILTIYLWCNHSHCFYILKVYKNLILSPINIQQSHFMAKSFSATQAHLTFEGPTGCLLREWGPRLPGDFLWCPVRVQHPEVEPALASNESCCCPVLDHSHPGLYSGAWAEMHI